MKDNKILGAAIFLLVILFIMSCSEDPVSPTNEKENLPEALVTKEIGSSGGTIETEEISITIPPGALGEKYNIAIYDIADDGAFGENSVSSFFKISGLTEGYSKPIQVKIKHNQQLSGDAFLASGVNWFSEIDGDSSIIYKLNPAIDSSGFIVGQLPPEDYSYLGKTSNIDFSAHPISIFITPLISYSELKTEHFELTIPFTLSEHLQRIGEILENSYKIATNNLKLPYPLVVERWKVAVKIQKEKVTGGFTPQSALLNINRQLVAQSKYDEIQIALGEKLIELGLWNIIYQQNPGFDNKNIIQPGFFSLISSIQTWSEEQFTSDPNFKFPEKFRANYLAPFNGIRAGSGTNLVFPFDFSHGFGNASLIKYLVEDNRFGIQGIINTFSDIGKGQYPTASIINNFDGLFVEWFPDFFKKYVNGEIYSIPFDYFLDEAKHIWNIDGKDDTLKVFASSNYEIKNYPDLSAKLFKINLNDPELVSEQNMLLSMKGPVTEGGLSLVVFGVQNGEQVYLGTASAQDFEIPNLKEYYDNNMRQFLVVLVNSLGGSPFLSESEIDLTIKINKKDESILSLTKCIVSVKTLTVIHREFTDGSQDDLIKYTTFISDYALGSFNGNVYTGTYDLYGVQGTIIITLNDAQNEILSINWQMTYNDGSGETSFTGMNIPLSSNISGEFSLLGSTVCGSISALTYSGQTISETFNLQSFSCDEESHIYVNFSKDQ